MVINYNNRTFRTACNSDGGETSEETVFHYKQAGNIVTAEYAGGRIRKGLLLGLVDENGAIQIRYQQINDQDQLMTGKCVSVPTVLSNGKIRLDESWQWTSGDCSTGSSIIEEI